MNKRPLSGAGSGAMKVGLWVLDADHTPIGSRSRRVGRLASSKWGGGRPKQSPQSRNGEGGAFERRCDSPANRAKAGLAERAADPIEAKLR